MLPLSRPQGDIVRRGFGENKRFLQLAGKHKKPAMPVLQELMAGVSQAAKDAQAQLTRDTPFVNEIKTITEGLPALQWVIIEPLPLDIVNSYTDAAAFWANKVRVANRGKADGKKNIELVDTFNKLLLNLAKFVKKNYKTGLVWNGAGTKLESAASAGAAASSGGGGGGAATPAAAAKPAPASAGGAGGRPAGGGLTALFSEIKSIDQSKGKTEGLRHVTKDMKSKAAPAKVSSRPTGSARGAPKGPKGTPSVKLIQKRWLVENQGRGAPCELDEGVDKEKEVYITGCVGATIVIKAAKAKAITLDNCYDTQVVFGSLLSSCEVVNCKKVKIQTKGSCKAFAIDKTDGITVYLSWESRDAQILTSKSSEMNCSFPDRESDDAEWLEVPIPEQFVSTVGADNKLSSQVSELYG